MKRNQFILILVLLVALGGVALFLRNRDSASWSSSATASSDKILSFPLNDVSNLTIKTSEAELDLVKKEGIWRVTERSDYPADFEKVAGLLRKLWELKPAQDVEVGPSQFGRLQLVEPGKDPNSGTSINLKDDSSKVIGTLLLGKKLTQDSNPAFPGRSFSRGRYVMTPARPGRVFLVSEGLDEVQIKPEQWLDRDFVKAQNAKSITLVGTEPAKNWTISRDTESAPWTLVGIKPGEEVDAGKAGSIPNFLSSLSFTDVLAPDKPATETGLDQPSTLTIETFDGFSYDVKIGKLMETNYPVLVSVKATLPNERKAGADEKPEDKTKLDKEFKDKQKTLHEKLEKEQKLAGRPYLVAKSTVDQLLKDRSALLKPPPTPSPAPSVPMPPVNLAHPPRPAASPIKTPPH